MIPALTASGALPPFIGEDATIRAHCSPYTARLSEIWLAFAQSPHREGLFRGLLAYRDALRAAGVTGGFQIIDGSFTEDSERLRGRPPSDIDVVTFARLPVEGAARAEFMAANNHLFDPEEAKETFDCDAYFVDMSKPPHLLVADTAYWFSLFSHQRVTALWKGLLQVSLDSDDEEVRQALDAVVV